MGTTARIQRRVSHGQPEKTLENEAVLPTAFRNEATTSGLGAFENPNGKTPREILAPWPRPVPQAVETKSCDKASGRLKARSGIAIHDDMQSIRGGRWSVKQVASWGPGLHPQKMPSNAGFLPSSPRQAGPSGKGSRAVMTRPPVSRPFRRDSCIQIDRYHKQGFPDRQAA